MESNGKYQLLLIALVATLLVAAISQPVPAGQADNPNPPDEPVKLIFIHHSTGENWLTDGYGDLGRTLGQNNYYVSDTNYGWGPNGIGDRTDIPDWVEWFRSADTPTYMAALFDENGQNSSYTRTLSDPGGENQIVMFKSCFPNSDLSGNPGDPPGTYADMTVAGAKFVYNQLLTYFASRPDKLFVVITQPPLSDPSNAANARAFTQWLVNDWLRENNYQLNNVAVFDFFNVLTGPDAHHTYRDGAVLEVLGSRNTLYYPSGDDHPSVEGSKKATTDFVPLLNVYYHRWQANAPAGPAPDVPPVAEAGTPAGGQVAPPIQTGMVDDFEVDNPPGTNGWEPFWDEASQTSMHCTADSGIAQGGARSLLLDFDVTPGAWATCALFYDQAQNWSGAEGLSFAYHAAQPGLVFNMDLYAGSPEAQETYVYTIEAVPESTDGWVPVSLRWMDIHRADWEANAGAPFTATDRVLGLAFGFETYEDAPNTGTLWVDDVSLLGNAPAEMEGPVESEPESAQGAGEGPRQPDFRRQLPCGSALLLPLGLVGLLIFVNRRRLER